MCLLMSLHVGNKHRQHLHSCRGNSVWAINNQSHDLLYFGSKKKRKIEWNWKSGRHAFNLLARIWQMHLWTTLSIISHLLKIKHFSWGEETKQDDAIFEHALGCHQWTYNIHHTHYKDDDTQTHAHVLLWNLTNFESMILCPHFILILTFSPFF